GRQSAPQAHDAEHPGAEQGAFVVVELHDQRTTCENQSDEPKDDRAPPQWCRRVPGTHAVESESSAVEAGPSAVESESWPDALVSVGVPVWCPDGAGCAWAWSSTSISLGWTSRSCSR